jgi:hypothetical protein
MRRRCETGPALSRGSPRARKQGGIGTGRSHGDCSGQLWPVRMPTKKRPSPILGPPPRYLLHQAVLTPARGFEFTERQCLELEWPWARNLSRRRRYLVVVWAATRAIDEDLPDTPSSAVWTLPSCPRLPIGERQCTALKWGRARSVGQFHPSREQGAWPPRSRFRPCSASAIGMDGIVDCVSSMQL